MGQIYTKLLSVMRIRDFYPGSRILIFTHSGSRIQDPGSRIPDPKTATKERVEKTFVFKPFFQCCGSMTFWGLIWIRIRHRRSMPLTDGSGFGFGSGSWIRILLFASLTFKMQAKNKFFNTIFSTSYFLKLHLHHFSKMKSQNESQNSRNQVFSYYFCR